MKPKIKITEDGSSTLFVPELNEHYHSIHGAIQESRHVFIEAGLKQIQKDSISIFEMGLGTGLNCLLTLLETKNKKVIYHAVEKYPLLSLLIDQLNYPSILNLSDEALQQFFAIHTSAWSADIAIRDNFIFRKEQVDISLFQTSQKFDLIYYDAFSPDVQPELWTEQVFHKIVERMNPGGILVTYCAKGSVRRNLQNCGLSVERIPGPPGKREMLRASRK